MLPGRGRGPATGPDVARGGVLCPPSVTWSRQRPPARPPAALSPRRPLVHAAPSGDCGAPGPTLKETGRGGGRVPHLLLRPWAQLEEKMRRRTAGYLDFDVPGLAHLKTPACGGSRLEVRA